MSEHVCKPSCHNPCLLDEKQQGYWETRAKEAELKVLTFHQEIVKLREVKMRDDQIKYMVERFLQWRLPENFNPDAGISFKKTFNENTAHPMKHEPVGTNLFDATQAEEMIRYLVAGMPSLSPERSAEVPGAGSQRKVSELKKHLQVAHNVLRTEFGRKCDLLNEKCDICLEVEATMSAERVGESQNPDTAKDAEKGGAN